MSCFYGHLIFDLPAKQIAARLIGSTVDGTLPSAAINS
jgi:hypothetical protein